MRVLKQLVPAANANYDFILGVLSEPRLFNPAEERIASFVNTTAQLIGTINDLFLLIKEAESFSFTPRRLCKIGDDFKFRTTILSLVTNISNLMGAQDFPLLEEDSLTLQDVVCALMPSAEIKARLLDACGAFLLVDESFRFRIGFLRTLHELFSSLVQNCNALFIKDTFEMCRARCLTLSIDSSNIEQTAQGLLAAIVLGQQLLDKSTLEKLEFEIENRQRSQVLTTSGERLAMIPNQKDPFFVEKDGVFYFPTEEQEWDMETMSPKTRRALVEVTVKDGLITSPERFRGAPSPVVVVVPFPILCDIVNKHRRISHDNIRNVQKSYAGASEE
jgi:hypothetical protein